MKPWTRFTIWVKNDTIRWRRYARSFLAWFGGMMIPIVGQGIEKVALWDTKTWAKNLGVAAVFGVVGAINLGDKNPPP